VEAFEHYLLPSPKGVYDHVAVDTLARDPCESVEGRFVDEMERDDRVRLYVKLPRWFTVPTPLGSYNPDWALVLEERDEFGDPRDTLYLVAETKGTTRLEDLPPDQRRKVLCDARHFGSQQLGEPGTLRGVEYRLASSMSDLS
jgi:type III restriction enzyme